MNFISKIFIVKMSSNGFKGKWKRKLGSIAKARAEANRAAVNKDNDRILLKMKELGYPITCNVFLGPGTIHEPLIFSNHVNGKCLPSQKFYPNIKPFIQSAFIDPGKVSCAIRIVRYTLGDGNVEVIWFGIHNFGCGLEQAITGVETELEVIKETLQMSHFIVIESQLMKSEVNYRTFQHMISYIEKFVRDVGMKAIIVEVEIPVKTVFIGGPKTERQYSGVSIKEWSKKKARYELIRRGDYLSNAIIESCLCKQEEDLCDTVCYEYAWWGYIRSIKHLFQDITWLYPLL
jgi:hypothetical protein